MTKGTPPGGALRCEAGGQIEVDPLNMVNACPPGSSDPFEDMITWLEPFTQSARFSSQ